MPWSAENWGSGWQKYSALFSSSGPSLQSWLQMQRRDLRLWFQRVGEPPAAASRRWAWEFPAAAAEIPRAGRARPGMEMRFNFISEPPFGGDVRSRGVSVPGEPGIPWTSLSRREEPSMQRGQLPVPGSGSVPAGCWCSASNLQAPAARLCLCRRKAGA